MQGACDGPIWHIDDLSQCFQRKYLGFIFPIAAIIVSLILIVSHTLLYRIAEKRRKNAYNQIPSDVVDVYSDDPNGDANDEEEDLMLHKALSRTADIAVEPNRPWGKPVINTVEVLALVAEVITSGIAISTVETPAKVPAIARLSSWAYILLLTCIRLLCYSSPKRPASLPKLWNHTATLYALQWLFLVMVLRSVIIHPPADNSKIFVIVDASLSTLLLLIALTTRKGDAIVLVQHEEGLTPPKDQFASVLSLATFAWMDSMIWEGYKNPLTIKDVWNLKPKYQATAVLVSFRQAKKSLSLAWKLLRYFKRTLLIQGAWTAIAGLFTFIPTWLLKLILEYVEEPESKSRNAAWLYVTLMFVCGVTQAISDGQALWIGRELSVKLRAIIVGELYAKALRRKAGAYVGHVKEKQENEEQKGQNKLNFFKKNKNKATVSKENKPEEHAEEVDLQANIGKIINLMAIDSFKVSEICAYLHFLWASVPIQVVVAVYFLYQVLGVSAFAGILMMVLIAPANVYIASRFRKVQHSILSSTDARVHSTNEVLQNIRIIKYFAWEQRFEGIINEKRRIELKYLRKRFWLWSMAATLFYGTPLLTTLSTFFIFTVVEGKHLIPSIAFPALAMFALLRVPLDRLADMAAHVLEAKVSIDRVEHFLNEEETAKYHQLRSSNSQEEPRICLENATLAWGSSVTKPAPHGTGAFRLIGVDVNFQIEKLNVIAGPTGSGKTSMLMALLGEMNLIEGSVSLPGGTSDRADLRPNPETGLIESVAYCAQEAWLVNGTIKENILFSSPYDEHRYNAVIHACSLERDLEILDAGDLTPVGEKGIGLSGGQKQRISLARAMYSRARHLLLDDCLSAVDSHTAQHIFQNAIRGPLMMHRTCILVTHNITLALPQAEYAVLLNNGRVTAQGSPQDLIASGALDDGVLNSGPSSIGASRPISRAQSNLEELVASQTATEDANGEAASKKKNKDAALAFNAEEKVTGSVPLSTIFMYLRAMGPWYYWVLALGSFMTHQLASLAPNVWVRQWANSYEIRDTDPSMLGAGNLTLSNSAIPTFNLANKASSFIWQSKVTDAAHATREYADINESYFLGVYAVLAVAYIFITLFRELIFFWGSLHASRKIHTWLIRAVSHAKFRFFDSTPLGRIMNRFSKDIESIDQEVAGTAIGMMHCAAAVVMIVILISIITPGFLIAGVFITMIYFGLGLFYLSSSRDLKRLESIQRSPLYQQFGETLNGVVTIRAYGDGARFILDNHTLINTYNRPYIYLWAANRWLSARVDVTGALVSFFSAMFVLLQTGKIDAGAAGLSMTYAITFAENILWLVRLYAENQQNMNSVERIDEYIKVEQEAAAIVPDNRPARNWPTHGAVKFVEYSTRYRPELDCVLKNVSFSIQPGERVGIVGRTGAGKSSLALALFRGLEAVTGRILIDNVDVGLIGLQDLRESITIVPQDPTLFTGTIRTNLDPFGLFTDEEIFTALRQVHLIGPPGPLELENSQQNPAITELIPESDASLLLDGSTESDTAEGTTVGSTTYSSPPTSSHQRDTHHHQDNKNIFLDLESHISESGSNLSQGQRQLLCLARALLKSPKVLLMDEATASIDYATDAKIQDTLRELKGNTILTIAHRLQTIIDYDKVLVLDHGQVKEFDGPWQLINQEGGIFRSMCENTGNMEALLNDAKKAWEQKRLVDDS
ncbi:hypothetical protein FQN57_007218 [Myotisia sp. PD_48]|nr:hypothetical protein FQN57_007218 [Myotisia sp. PD_48]